MFEEVKKLKNKKEKLKGKRKIIDTEITRIDSALVKFEEGIQVLSGLKPRSATAEIEVILREAKKPMSVREITDELHRRGFEIAFQSVSAALQRQAKRRDKYRRVAPATFDLLSNRKSVKTGQ